MSDGNSPRFDPTINLGHIITLSGVVLAIVASYYSFSARLTTVEMQISRIATVLEASIRQEEQIKNVHQRLERLEARR